MRELMIDWNAASRDRTGCYLFTVSNSGLLPVHAQFRHAHFRHSLIDKLNE